MTQPGDGAGRVAWAFVQSASHGGTTAHTVGRNERCSLRSDHVPTQVPQSPQHLFALRTLTILLGCSAMASGGKGYYAAQAASSSSSAAGGDPAPGWSAADSLRQLAAQRAAQWRESEGLQEDNDFAYAFLDFDQVVGVAGHHVADDWLRVRARVEEGLLAAGARVIEGSSRTTVTLRPARKTIFKKKAKSTNVEKNYSEAIQKRINGMVSMFQGMGAFKPAGILTDALRSEWKQTCRRIAEKKVQDAEKATVDRVVTTWLELRAFLEGRGRPAPPEVVDLDQFLQHTAAPARALQALKWMNKNAQQEMDLSNLQVPAKPRATGKPGQAPVVEPPLIKALEERIVELHAVGDERWTVLLGSWMMAFGCLRYAHITRSEPRRLTQAFLHCRCLKGKQRQNRDGFDYAIPATFSNGFFWGKEVIEAFRTLAPLRQRSCGLCFSDEGRPWQIGEIQETMQAEMAVMVDNAEEITTYSWRRVGPTVAQLLGCKPEEMSALGDWQSKSEGPEVGQMALHYSDAKYAASIKMKSLIWGASACLTDNLLWEAIPQEELDKARTHGLAEADRLLRQDRQPVWASSQKFQDVRKRIKLSQQFVEAAERARKEAEQAASPTMPDQLNGKILTATLKNGKPLCPDFQQDACPNDADTCPFGAHLCAVLQQSGRACGGKHGAAVCRIKRAVLATTPAPVVPKPSATLVPAAVGGRAQFGRKRTLPEGVEGEPKRAKAAPKTPVKAMPRTPPKAVPEPKTPPRAAPKTPPKAPPKQAPQAKRALPKPLPKAAERAGSTPGSPGSDEALDAHLELLGVGTGLAQAPTCVWTSRKGGKIFLAGLPMAHTVHRFPKAALQVCCFPHGPESRGGVTLAGAQGMTFEAAYSRERNEQWGEVWPAIKNTVWHGDNVVIHCIKGRHRGAYLAVLCRALLAEETIDEANAFIEARRNTELHKVIRDKGMKKWLHEAFRDANVGNPHPAPQGYAATDRSSTHVVIQEGITLCQHKQADGKAKRLVQPYTSQDIYEAMAWGRPWCNECLRRAPASWWPPA